MILVFVISEAKASVSFSRTKTTPEKGDGEKEREGDKEGRRERGADTAPPEAKPADPWLLGGSCGCHRSSLRRGYLSCRVTQTLIPQGVGAWEVGEGSVYLPNARAF